MPYEIPSDLSAMSLPEIAAAVEARKLPPIEKWQPEESIDSGMRIAANGSWFYQGSPIGRAAMVRAFSSLLMRDHGGQHWLMTPQCRQSIEVEDAAFIAVDMTQDGNALAFRLNTDDIVLAGPDNPLRVTGEADCPAIYLAVRHGCEARLDRSTWLQLADHALALGHDPLAIASQGAIFTITPA